MTGIWFQATDAQGTARPSAGTHVEPGAARRRAETGYEQGANDLTWSYGTLLSGACAALLSFVCFRPSPRLMGVPLFAGFVLASHSPALHVREQLAAAMS